MKKSLKLNPQQKKLMKKIEILYLQKGFRSFSAVCKKLNIDRSNASKSFVGILQNNYAIELKKMVANEIGYKF